MEKNFEKLPACHEEEEKVNNFENKECWKKEDYILLKQKPEENLEHFIKRIIETKEKEMVIVIFNDNLFEFSPRDGNTLEKTLEKFNENILLGKNFEKEKERIEEGLAVRKEIFENNPELLNIYNNYLNLKEKSNQENKKRKDFDFKKYPSYELGSAIRQFLPEIPNDHIRMWRGCRKNEIGHNPSYTNSLEGIALPFLRFYRGFLSYVDIPKKDALRYLNTSGGAPGAEFFLPEEVIKNARIVGFDIEREKEIKENAKSLKDLEKQSKKDNLYGFD